LPSGTLTRRICALAYEGLLILSIYMLAGAAFLGAVESTDLVGEARLIFQLYLFVTAGVYFTICWRIGKQTLPMKAWKLHLEAADGRPLNLRKLLLRYSLACLSWAILGFGYAWAVVDPDSQFLHDRLSGTRIVASLT